MFETEIGGPCLVWKLKWEEVLGGGHDHPGPHSGYAPGFLIKKHVF